MRKLLFIVIVPLALAACASTPSSDQAGYSVERSRAADAKTTAAHAADSAQKMLGKPYRYGGSGPVAFDCSGLVMFSFRQAGVALPHNTEQQRVAARKIKFGELRPGDLVFFDQEGKKHSHVGIYLGGGKFVHAPSSGKRVRNDRLDNPYWKKHLSDIRRIA